jgi:hypothetical protein
MWSVSSTTVVRFTGALGTISMISCGGHVIVQGAAGVGGGGPSMQIGVVGGGAAGMTSAGASNGSSGPGGAGGATASCAVDLGPTSPTGSCDGTGFCGGVASTEGCINCAMHQECGQYYDDANADQDAWMGWNECSSQCGLSGSPDWACCDRSCDAEFPTVAAAMNAFNSCIFCRWCTHDCGQPEPTDLRCD